MGTVYRRGSKLWINYKDAGGRRSQKATGLDVGQETVAEELLVRIEARVAAGSLIAETEVGSITFGQYFEHWIAGRKRRGVSMAADDDTRIRLHALAALGSFRLEAVRTAHIREVVRGLTEKGRLAPKTIHHVYRLLRQIFGDAVSDGLLRTTPAN